MDPQIYQKMMALEETHWWFVARRSIIKRVIDKLTLPESAEIFEAGCGTGGNLAMLADRGRVYAMELDETARLFASNLKLAEVQSGSLPNDIPFPDRQFDLIVLLDVLEHIEEDSESLQALAKKLKPSGWLLITVPAYAWMWSKQDVILHHKRRYILSNLHELVVSAGYKVDFVSYFNFFLFPVIAGIRLLQGLLGRGGNELTMPPKSLNNMLISLFSKERYLLDSLSLPFGVSIMLLAQKNVST